MLGKVRSISEPSETHRRREIRRQALENTRGGLWNDHCSPRETYPFLQTELSTSGSSSSSFLPLRRSSFSPASPASGAFLPVPSLAEPSSFDERPERKRTERGP